MKDGGYKLLTFKKVETQDELKEACKFRFKVYCTERYFESESNYPDKIERDEYDDYSIHFIAKTNDQIVGTARLILNNPFTFPVERYCKLNFLGNGIKKNQIAEISRFAISKESLKSAYCNRQEVVHGLFREMYHESKKLGINYFCAAMGKSLQKLLSKYGIIFIQAGPMVNYHGIRAPYISAISNLEESVFMKSSHLFNYIVSPQVYQYA